MLIDKLLAFPICVFERTPCLHDSLIEATIDLIEKFNQIKKHLKQNKLDALEKHMLNLFIMNIIRGEDLGSYTYASITSQTVILPDFIRNILNGCDFLTREILPDKENLGLLEIDNFILPLHKHLMNGLITNPGKFSNQLRYTFDGTKIHNYPLFGTTELAEETLQTTIDSLNNMIFEIKTLQDKKQKLKCCLKFGSLLLSALLNLHVFSDGNGRTIRLLLAYVMREVLPFYIFCGENRDDYLERIKMSKKFTPNVYFINDARKLGTEILHQSPSILTEMLVESAEKTMSECFSYLYQQT